MTILNIQIKTCSHPDCKNNAKQRNYKSKLGFPLYIKYCNKHSKEHYKKKYRLHKKTNCELCGFVPEHLCQLDVDHKDGNKKNNTIENLQTLCANCHRLKTHLNKDYIKRQPN
jgi:5-methylcytosine-specific restriction endonuclease McrA